MSEQRELKFRVRVGSGFEYFTLGDGCGWVQDGYGSSEKFEQYTGLHDKNGVEIYEGDILLYTPQKWTGTEGKYEYDDNEHLIAVPRNIYIDMEPVQRGPVSWDETGGWFPFADNDDGMPYPDALRCEVIGNIHENPELLEERNES